MTSTRPRAATTGAGSLPRPAIDITALLMGVGFAFMWSSAFSSAKIALDDAPPLLLLTARFLVSGIIAVAIGALLGQRLPRLPRQWGMLTLLGLCQNSLYLGLFFVAMTTVPAGLASIIASAMPLLVAALGPLVSPERLGGRAAIGLLLGFGGVVAIMANRLGGDLDVIGMVLCLVGVTALATATLVVRHADLGTGLFMIVGLQMLIGCAALAPFGLALESFEDVDVTWSLVAAFAYTTLVPGVIATWLWFALIGRIGAARASAFHFLNPAFGVAVAWALLAEPVGVIDMVGVAIVAVGILLVQVSRVRSTRPVP